MSASLFIRQGHGVAAQSTTACRRTVLRMRGLLQTYSNYETPLSSLPCILPKGRQQHSPRNTAKRKEKTRKKKTATYQWSNQKSLLVSLMPLFVTRNSELRQTRNYYLNVKHTPGDLLLEEITPRQESSSHGSGNELICTVNSAAGAARVP